MDEKPDWTGLPSTIQTTKNGVPSWNKLSLLFINRDLRLHNSSRYVTILQESRTAILQPSRSRGSHQRVVVTRWWRWRAHGSRGNHQRVARTRWWSLEVAAVGHRLWWSDGGGGGHMEAEETTNESRGLVGGR